MKQAPDAYMAIVEIKKFPPKRKLIWKNKAPIFGNHEFFRILIEDVVKNFVPK